MSRFSLTLILCVCSLYAWSQAYTNPSPDANGLVKLANTPVNYFTGTPDISIPLTELRSRELSVPVTLNYNASGFKVSETAGYVGLGWSLSAGGMISRVVRGLPDELANGYCGVNNRGEQAGASTGMDTYSDNVATGTYDGEPDIFYFSIPGRSGKFILDAQGLAFTMPYQDIQITPAICGGTGEWILTDENGVVYRFGTLSTAREQMSTRVDFVPSSQRSYISSWYLSKITSPNGTDWIDFTYTSGSIEYVEYYHTKIEDSSPCNGNTNEDTSENNNIAVTSIYPATITCSQGTLTFEWGNRRQDLIGGLYLKSISLTNHSSQLIHKNKFAYSYFMSGSCTCPNESLCKRLKLDYVYDLAPDPIASFTYNTSTLLPPRDSKNFDHWGFYNSNTVDSWLPASYYNDIYFTDNNHNFSGASRAPDPERSKANILTRIDSRGGGYQAFTFEGHSVCNAYFGCNGNVSVGGVRIASIQLNDGNGNTITRTFSYWKEGSSTLSSGLAYYIPSVYAYRINSHTFKRFSNSLTSVFDINGTHVGYSRVEEAISGNGKTVYYYSNFDTNPDGGYVIDIFNPAYIPATQKGWERGNLLEVKVLNSSGTLLKHQINKYKTNWAEKRNITAWVTRSKSYSCSPALDYNAGSYTILSQPISLTWQINETYDPATPTRKMSKVSYFEYDPITLQNLRKTEYDSTQRTTKFISDVKYVTNSDYYYAQTSGVDCQQQYQLCTQDCDDITNPSQKQACLSGCISAYSTCLQSSGSPDPPAAAILKLKNRHQISAPVELRTTYTDPSGTKVLSSTVNIFSVSGAAVNLAEKWNMNQPLATGFTATSVATNGTFQKDNTHLRKVQVFDSYNATSGTLAQMTDVKGIVTSYTYDANNLLASATISGGVHSGTTTYTNITQLGKTSETDENGMTTNFEYDGYGRLHIVKNGVDVIGRRLQHYKNETAGFAINGPTETVVNVANTFSVADIAVSAGGTPSFMWDFGDGNPVTDGSTSVSRAFTTTGVHYVKLVGTNAELGSATRTQAVIVNTALTASTCANGPTRIDQCGVLAPINGPCTDVYHEDGGETLYTVTVSGGCSSYYTYSWDYKLSTDTNWTPLSGTCPENTFSAPSGLGLWYVRCTITDNCGHTTTTQGSINIMRNTPDCSNPGGGPGGIK